MSRIAIIGNAGSGKSYVARQLGAIHALPVVDLDDLFWLRPGDYTTKRPLDELMSLVDSQQRREAWIVEGVFGELIEPFLSKAEQLIWLDIPWEVSLGRLRARHHKQGEADEGSFNALLAWAAAYWQREDGRSHAGHGRVYEGFRGQKRRFTSEDDVNIFLQRH